MEEKENIWREKALNRRVENKELHKRIKELKESRDNWKQKYVAQKQKSDLFVQQIDAIKKKLNEIIGK